MEQGWVKIKNYNYSINKLGQLKNNKTNKLIKVSIGKIGYKVVNLWKNNKYKTFYVHRLLCIYFKVKKRNKNEVNHIDGNRLNNDLNNLEWCSRTDNVHHALNTGLVSLGEKRKGSKLSNKQALDIYNFTINKTYSVEHISLLFKISKTQVYQIKNKKEWKHIHNKKDD